MVKNHLTKLWDVLNMNEFLSLGHVRPHKGRVLFCPLVDRSEAFIN